MTCWCGLVAWSDMTTWPRFESILASSRAFLIKLTIHLSASFVFIFNFSANISMLWSQVKIAKKSRQPLPNALMNSAKCFENNLSRIFDKLFSITSKEKIILENGRTLFQHFLGLSKVKLDVQTRTTVTYWLDNKQLTREWIRWLGLDKHILPVR